MISFLSTLRVTNGIDGRTGFISFDVNGDIAMVLRSPKRTLNTSVADVMLIH